MKRSPGSQLAFLAAWSFGLAPVGFGIIRAWRTGDDFRLLWMAVVSSLFAAGVLAAAIGRRRSRRGVAIQALVIFVVSTVLAAGTGLMQGATAGPGVWAVSVVLGLCLALSSILVAYARAT